MDIELELHLNAGVDVDDEKGMMKSSGWVGFGWMDEYARWNPAEFGGIKEIRVPASMFWVPDVYLFNDAKGDFQSGILKNDVRVWKSSDGSAHWYTPTLFNSLCDMTTQNIVNVTCPLVFGSWMYHEGYIKLESPAFRHSKVYECCPEPYVDITWDISLTRRRHDIDEDKQEGKRGMIAKEMEEEDVILCMTSKTMHS